jgi:hypothetical protein
LSAADLSLGTFSCAGRTYTNAKVLKKDDQHVTILHESGTTKLELLSLPKSTADKLKFDPNAINVAELKSAKQRQADQEASAAKIAGIRAEEVAEENRKADQQLAATNEKSEQSRLSASESGSKSSLNTTSGAKSAASATGDKKPVSQVRSGRRRNSFSSGGGRRGGGGGGGSC